MTTNRKVLIVDDDDAFAQALSRRCSGLGLEAETASDGLEALLAGLRNPPDLFILDVNLPGTDGLSLCEKISGDAQLKAVPVIVLTGGADQALVQRCNSLGARYCFKGLEVWDNLEPLICDVLDLKSETAVPSTPETAAPETSAPAPPPKVLVIDDDPHITKALWIRLGALGIEVTRSSNAKQGNQLAVKEKPDVIITDFHMPGLSRERLVLNLNSNPGTRDIPVIVMTGDTVNGQQNHALQREFLGRLKAAAYFSKPLDFEALLEELARHISLPANPIYS